MSQTPVLFPGAALSRNSVMRNSALQAGAYASMDAASARLPVTCDEALVTSGANPLTANKARFARLKLRDNADSVCSSIINIHGYTASGTHTVGSALYEYNPQPFGFSLALVDGGFFQITGPSSVEVDVPMRNVISLIRTKTYVIGVVNDSPSSFTSGCWLHSIASGPDIVTYAETVNSVTRSSGWPKKLDAYTTKSYAPGGDIAVGVRSNLFSVISNAKSDQDQLYGFIY